MIVQSLANCSRQSVADTLATLRVVLLDPLCNLRKTIILQNVTIIRGASDLPLPATGTRSVSRNPLMRMESPPKLIYSRSNLIG